MSLGKAIIGTGFGIVGVFEMAASGLALASGVGAPAALALGIGAVETYAGYHLIKD